MRGEGVQSALSDRVLVERLHELEKLIALLLVTVSRQVGLRHVLEAAAHEILAYPQIHTMQPVPLATGALEARAGKQNTRTSAASRSR